MASNSQKITRSLKSILALKDTSDNAAAGCETPPRLSEAAKRKASSGSDSEHSSEYECRAPVKKAKSQQFDSSAIPPLEFESAETVSLEQQQRDLEDIQALDAVEALRAATPSIKSTPHATDNSTKTSYQISYPLMQMNDQMHLYKPELVNEEGKSLVVVSKKGKYINVEYKGMPQKFPFGFDKPMYKMTLMTPFALTRYVDPLPFGSVRNRFNDPTSTYFKQSKIVRELIKSQLGFQLTNDRITTSELQNTEMNHWFTWLDTLEGIIFEQVLKNINNLDSNIYDKIKRTLDKAGQDTTNENMRRVFRDQHWKGIKEMDAKNDLLQVVGFNPQVFNIATDVQKQLLAASDYKCLSGNPEITAMLKESLHSDWPRWENDFNMYRVLSKAEREANPDLLFAKMSYDEVIRDFAGKSTVVSVVFQLSITIHQEVVRLKHEPIGFIYYGSSRLFEAPMQLNNVAAIQFDCV